jgi:hypothetical protein
MGLPSPKFCHSPSDTSGSMIPLRAAGAADAAP